jgi:hypothetical protein
MTTSERIGRWYEAMGGIGLEVKDADRDWRVGGLIITKGKGRHQRFEIQVNRYEDTRTDATRYFLDDAKETLLRFCGVTKIIESDGAAAA